MPLYTRNNQVNKLVPIRRLTPYLSRRVVRFKGGSPGARLLVEQMRDFPTRTTMTARTPWKWRSDWQAGFCWTGRETGSQRGS